MKIMRIVREILFVKTIFAFATDKSMNAPLLMTVLNVRSVTKELVKCLNQVTTIDGVKGDHQERSRSSQVMTNHCHSPTCSAGGRPGYPLPFIDGWPNP